MMKGWKEVSPGGVIDAPGSTTTVETGTWRSKRPVVDYTRCVHCMICWMFCPDGCFQTENGKLVGVDYFHCKGCAICVTECPKKCIIMEEDVLA
ncbi:MAG: 4Fe-4S binding protein [Chloroflexi bacterium]|nr:4Fe-4S binding protein [Chloroflexota bacterium]